MSLMLHKLNNIRSLRALSREFSIDVLEEMLEKLRIVTEEKRTQQQLAAQQQAEYQEKVNTWLELMRADGISPDDLVADIQPSMAVGKKRQPRPAKYRYTDHTGAEKPGPVREECRSRLLRRLLRANRWTVSSFKADPAGIRTVGETRRSVRPYHSPGEGL